MKNSNLTVSSLALYQPSLIRAKILKNLAVFFAKIGLAKLIFRNKVHLERNDAELQRLFRTEDLEYAIFTGTEGSHRKVTVQVMNEKGTILGYIKISENEEVDKLLKNETEILRNLSTLEIENGLFPKIIYHGEIKGINVLILDTLKGIDSRFSSKLSEKHVSFLAEIMNKTSGISKFNESKFALALRGRLMDLEKRTDEILMLKDTYERALDYIDKEIGEDEIPFGLCHRDFTPWNTFFHNKKLYVFDWEYARNDYPPFLDLFHFIIQNGILVKHLKPVRLLKEVQKNKKWLSMYGSLVGIKENLIIPLLLCYLLDSSLLYIEREKSSLARRTLYMVRIWKEMMEIMVRQINRKLFQL